MMDSSDRIADIWGPRHSARPERCARRESTPPRGRCRSRVGGPPGAVGVCAVQQRCGCDIAVKDGRTVGVRKRAGDAVIMGAPGARMCTAAPPGRRPWTGDRADGQPWRGPGGDGLDHRHGRGRRREQAALGGQASGVPRVLHLRATLHRGAHRAGTDEVELARLLVKTRHLSPGAHRRPDSSGQGAASGLRTPACTGARGPLVARVADGEWVR